MKARLILLCALVLPQSISADVTIFAAASLQEVVTAISAKHGERSGEKTRIQFGASSALARQIQEGATADVIIVAAPEWLDALNPLDRYDWLSNRLVCVTHIDAGSVDIRNLESLAIANEQVPVGKYARAAMKYLGIKIPKRTIYGMNVRDVLSTVTQGGATAGIVYATDAVAQPNVKIVYEFSPNSHPKIIYCVGLIRPAGKALFDELRKPSSVKIATDHGFIKVN